MSKQKTPKSILHEVFSIYRASPPKFDIQPGPPPPAPPAFLCTVTLQAINCKHGAFPKQEFQAEAQNKKSATHAACLNALLFIEAKKMLPPGIHVPTTPANAADEFLNELGRDFGSASQAGNASGSGQGTANGSQSDPDQQEVEEAIALALNGRLLESLTPQELREELEKALQLNSQLRAGFHHEEKRRNRAAQILLGFA